MPVRKRAVVAATLRDRIERALETGALVHGDRLPGTRETGLELSVDPRVVAAAYTDLADEGLVELRPRSGVYVSRQTVDSSRERRPPSKWLVDIFTDGVAQGFSTRDLCDHLREAALARKARVAVVGSTHDQIAGMCNELRSQFGVECTGVLSESLRRSLPLPHAVRRAHLIVTHESNGELVKRLAQRLGKPAIVATVRPEIIGDEWLLLLEREVFVIAADQRFIDLMSGFLAHTPGAENVTMLIAGRDDLSRISFNAPTYVTQAAREVLGRTRIPGHLVRPTRIFSKESVREILGVLVGINTD